MYSVAKQQLYLSFAPSIDVCRGFRVCLVAFETDWDHIVMNLRETLWLVTPLANKPSWP